MLKLTAAIFSCILILVGALMYYKTARRSLALISFGGAIILGAYLFRDSHGFVLVTMGGALVQVLGFFALMREKIGAGEKDIEGR